MSGDAQVRFCESLKVRSLRATRLVFIFQYAKDVERFYRVLPKRLNKYGLSMHEKKSQLIRSGHVAAIRAYKENKRLPTYKFLGFVCYWGKARSGYWRLKMTSRSDRFAAKLKGLREYLWKHLNTNDQSSILAMVIRVLRGWINYPWHFGQRKACKGFHQSK